MVPTKYILNQNSASDDFQINYHSETCLDWESDEGPKMIEVREAGTPHPEMRLCYPYIG